MTRPKSCSSKKIQGGLLLEQELAYSFHLGNDKKVALCQ